MTEKKDSTKLLETLLVKAHFVIQQGKSQEPDIDITGEDALELAEMVVELSKTICESGKIPWFWHKRTKEK